MIGTSEVFNLPEQFGQGSVGDERHDRIILPFSSATIVQHWRIKVKVPPVFAHHSTNGVRANLPTGQGSVLGGRIQSTTFSCEETK